jgi:hypothetical protein
MFNLFPKKKSVDEILEDSGIQPYNINIAIEYNELLKEVLQLRHLKKENVELIEEIAKKQNLLSESLKCIERLKEEIKEAKNAHCKTFLEAKLQVTNNDYALCAEQRDECKHQLNAANKEIEILKRWKKEQLTVQSWWDKVDKYVRDHDDTLLGDIIANTCLKFLKERDELKAEVKKLKEDIIDYVIEKDDDINWMADEGIPNDEEEQKHPMYPLHWGILQNAKELTVGVEVDLDKSLDEQCDEIKKSQNWSTFKVAIEDAVQAKQREVYGIETDAVESPWICPCNKCVDKRKAEQAVTWEQAASDLALRVVTLEKKVEELTILNTQLCQK